MFNKQKISASALMAILLLQALLFAFYQASASSSAKTEQPTEISAFNFAGTTEGQISGSPTIPSSGFVSLNQKRAHSGFHDRLIPAFSSSVKENRSTNFSQSDYKIFLQSYKILSLHLFYCVLLI